MTNAAAFSGGYVANLGPSEDGFLMPAVDEEGGFFWEGTLAGELRIQACNSCGKLRHPPRPMCPSCRSTAPGLEARRGQGHHLVLRRPPPAAARALLEPRPLQRHRGRPRRAPHHPLRRQSRERARRRAERDRPELDPHRRARRGRLQALPSRRRQRRGTPLLGAGLGPGSSRPVGGSRRRAHARAHARMAASAAASVASSAPSASRAMASSAFGVLGEEPLDGLVVG